MKPRKLKTRCKHGHPMTPGHENVYIAPSGERRCRKCMSLRRRALNRKKKAARRLASTLRTCVICGRQLPKGLRADAEICDRPECVRARHRGYYRRRRARERDD